MATNVNDVLKETLEFLKVATTSQIPFEGFLGLPLKAEGKTYYRGSNIAVLMAQMNKLYQNDCANGKIENHENYFYPHFSGFRGWAALGRKVKIGAKASFCVLASGFLKVSKEKQEEKAEVITREDALALSQQELDKYLILTHFKTIKTFHYSQTEPIGDGKKDKTVEAGFLNLPDYSDSNLIMKVTEAIERVFPAAKLHIDEENRNLKQEMCKGQCDFIERFCADIAVAHSAGVFMNKDLMQAMRQFPRSSDALNKVIGRYSEDSINWLQSIKPRSITGALHICYAVLQDIFPELAERDEKADEASKTFAEKKETTDFLVHDKDKTNKTGNVVESVLSDW